MRYLIVGAQLLAYALPRTLGFALAPAYTHIRILSSSMPIPRNLIPTAGAETLVGGHVDRRGKLDSFGTGLARACFVEFLELALLAPARLLHPLEA